jgi:putative nucleotidyltransferase with HDIG domain
MKRRDLRFPLLVGFLIAVATLATIVAWTRFPVRSDLTVASLLLGAVLVSELAPVLVPGRGGISLSYPLSVAVTVLLGPGFAAMAAAVAVVPMWLERDSDWGRRLFNAGQVELSTVVPGMIYFLLGGRLFASPSALLAGSLLPIAALVLTGVLLNDLLVSFAQNVVRGTPIRRFWTQSVSSMLPSQIALGFVGVAIAQIVVSVGVWGFALFIVPLIVARQTYQRSVQLREAYADTISSLVAALEAKDVYTKGHSVRVAKYSVSIAAALGISDTAIERLEYAALLHDIGKVGVSRRVLAKPSALSSDEFTEIKRHPDIGAHILADVPYLADLVPSIEAHHERLDGSGYGHGVSGDAIPLEARVLAVADAYDAMTSSRPYRSAMTHDAALRELKHCCGTQFDESVVDAFEKAGVFAGSSGSEAGVAL